MKKRILIGAFLAITLGFTSVSCSSDDSKESKTVEPGNGNTSVKYQHKVLIEDVTGTWCQWCPRVTYSIEKALEHETLGNKIIPVAIHFGDQMQIPAGGTLDSFFDVQGYPFALISRSEEWRSPQNNNLAQVYNTIQKNGSTVGIKITSELTNTGGSVSASFKFSEGFSDLKYSIYVIENEVVLSSSPQKNSTTYYGGNGNPQAPSSHPEFIHNDVLRAVYGTATGNSLGNATAGQEISKSGQNVSYTLYNKDLSKVEVVVFVTDSTGKVLNVQKAHANETVEYQILN
ncbi:hypothetical protein EG240_01500 [Paenimyroides tangerinum]|uniref:Outer membrane protein Omp28 n=1 Tax=Paenimyroides tangerinum TaxID=2488728 RepID=A0A3P3WJY8_9FLAO|nr:Omp28-related outer membrane protein [Paenimyroides tangerinum]RRJ93173.1 hypothetical protein EG240_01500 [Paenimyroides tangerinum]